MGPDGNDAYDAWSPAVAYNPTGDEYLVVWLNTTAGTNAPTVAMPDPPTSLIRKSFVPTSAPVAPSIRWPKTSNSPSTMPAVSVSSARQTAKYSFAVGFDVTAGSKGRAVAVPVDELLLRR